MRHGTCSSVPRTIRFGPACSTPCGRADRIRFGARASLLTAVVLAGGCSDPSGPPEPLEQLPRQLTVEETAVVSASNAFAFELLRQVVAREGTDENVFVSPFSVSMALGMTMNGAAGGTFDAMRDVLGFGGLDQTAINESYRDLTSLLLGLDERTELGIANSVWARQGHPFRESFFTAVRDYFDATARELDFGAPGAADEINGWVNDATNGRIEEIVQNVTPQHLMFLINAVYFKGEWTNRFDPARTRPRPFQVGAGGPAEVETMQGDLRAGLFAGSDVTGGELPYGNGAFTMVLAMPGGAATVDELVDALDPTAWDGWMQDVGYEEEVAVALPKWEMEYEARLDSALIDMGMGVAFDGSTADFTNLTPSGGSIDEVRHKTFLKVDEEGTEAAAATSVAVLERARPALHVDRPFLVAIRERFSGAILFIGVVRDPR